MAGVSNLNNFTFGFFNSVNGDRKYEAKEFSTIFEGIIRDGVYESVGDRFMVKESTIPDNKVQILEGRAWLNNIWIKNDSINVITLPDPGLVLDRIDAVCIEINESNIATSAGTPGRTANIVVISGTEASNPARPNLLNNEEIHQYALAYVYRHNGRDTTVRQSDITNNVGSSSLPYVTGPLQVHSVEQMVAQWNAQFNNWSNNVHTEFINWSDREKSEFTTWSNRQKTEFINWSDREKSEFLDWVNVNHEILESYIGGAVIDELNDRLHSLEDIYTGTLSAGYTTITINSNKIKTNSALSFYTSKYGVNPRTVSVSNGSVTLTFVAQSENITVGVKVDGTI